MSIEYKASVKILVKSIEQDHQNETTRVWFELNGEIVGLSSSNGEYTVLDFEGYPVEHEFSNAELNDIYQVLLPIFNKVLAEYCGEDCIINRDSRSFDDYNDNDLPPMLREQAF